jgi:hypothetical protein
VKRQKDRSGWGANIETPYMQRIKREAAQATYVREWREMYPELVWSDSWVCPLCSMTIQVNATQNNKTAGSIRDLRIRHHQEGHGDDWTAYQQAGT